MDRIAAVIAASEAVPGWTRGDEARALAELACGLPGDPVIVEVGSFLGSSAILLAGARRLCGGGTVHCVDAFDGSGDAFSVPYYRDLLARAGGRKPRAVFEDNIQRAGLSGFVVAHEGQAHNIARAWMTPVDLLFLDGDQSPAGARLSYEAWVPWLKAGGFIAVHNSAPIAYAEGHDGGYRFAREEIVAPAYGDIRVVGSTTFARKLGGPPSSSRPGMAAARQACSTPRPRG